MPFAYTWLSAIVVATYGISRWLQIATGPPEVEMPDWSLRDLPYQLGDWHGKDAKIDPKIAAATGAEVDREPHLPATMRD